MITAESLRDILKTVYEVEDKYLIPLSEHWFIPTINRDDKVGTWIGYRVLEKERYARSYQKGVYFVAPVRVTFRIVFVGKQAEELVDQTLLWENRNDVQDAFGKYVSQVNYTDRNVFSYPIKNDGFNDGTAWVVDLSAQTMYEVDTKQKPWFNPR